MNHPKEGIEEGCVIYDKTGIFEITEQRLADQVRVMKSNNWLSEEETEEIKRNIETKKQ